MKKQLIAFCGRQGSGKSYSSNKLRDEKGFVVFSFADKLRSILYSVLGFDKLSDEKYAELKTTVLYNNQTLRNMLENLGESIRKEDIDFWAKACVNSFSEKDFRICICDMRHANEYLALKDFCSNNNYELKVVFCDYHSSSYVSNNHHESAQLANFLAEKGYRDQEEVNTYDILLYKEIIEDKRNKKDLDIIKDIFELSIT